jgi:hypothetical protein
MSGNNNHNGGVDMIDADSNYNQHYQEHYQKYNYMCNECGEALRSLRDYLEHYRKYHPRSIGVAST